MLDKTTKVDEWKSNAATILDVRPVLYAGGEPFAQIVEAASALALNQSLLLIAPFEPAPLYDVLDARGFTHATEHIAGDEWVVCFTRER